MRNSVFVFLFPRLKDSRYAITQSICVPRLLFSTKNSRQPSTCGRCLPSTRGVDCSTFSRREKKPCCASRIVFRALYYVNTEKIFYRLPPRSHRCPMVTPDFCFAVICFPMWMSRWSYLKTMTMFCVPEVGLLTSVWKCF